MAINANTLYNLYNQGILDYVPMDLIGGYNTSALTPAQNPYLNSATQGQLYQNYGNSYDSFTRSPNYQNNIPIGDTSGNNIIGSHSNAGLNGFGIGGIGTHNTNGFGFGSEKGMGTHSNSGLNGFGIEGIGSQSNSGLNGFGIGGVGTQSNGGINAFGGFSDVKNGLNSISQTVQNTPNFIKGLVSGAIIIGTLSLCFRRGKKPATAGGSKLNPLNWFKRNK